jgi:hypothetical protein
VSVSHVTYGMVKPRLDEEINRLRDQLTTCQPDQLIRLQERVAALRLVDGWFAKAMVDTKIFDSAV